MNGRNKFSLTLLALAFASLTTSALTTDKLVGIVLKSTEDVWTAEFNKWGKTYIMPKLVLYSGSIPTGCGDGKKQMGPFYCPSDSKLYLDPTFYDELATKFGAPGDMAQAFVIAHEVGHHIQNMTGIMRQFREAQMQASDEVIRNQIQVRAELHADCLAGMWARIANRTKKFIEPGDMGEVLNAANKIGDDNLQKMQGMKVNPAMFTHGSGEDRRRWFTRGYLSGDFGVCMKVFSSKE